MFNVYQFDRKIKLNDDVEKMKRHYVKQSVARKEKQDQMIHGYKKRVEGFIMQMLENPIKSTTFGTVSQKFRDEDPSKYIGGSNILVKSFKTEKESIMKNHEFNTSHVDFNAFEFRKRDPSKDIQPQMHFSSKSGLDRIANKLSGMRVSLEAESKRFDQNDSFLLELSKSPVTATNKYIAKHFMPELHQKTHFRAASSYYLALPDCLVDKVSLKANEAKLSRKPTASNIGDSPMGKKDGDADFSMTEQTRKTKLPPLKPTKDFKDSINAPDEMEEQRVVEKNYNIESVNPAEISKQILLECNYIKPHNPNISPLKIGEGHLMSLSDKSLRQVYQDVYHKKLNTSSM